MLRCVKSMAQLDFEQLVAVYSDELLTRKDQEDFYLYLLDYFIGSDSSYYIWENDGRYVCVLRTEPYKGGRLITGLHCKTEFRNKGFAKKLLTAVCAELKKPIYSHIDKQNTPSLRTHIACGFCHEQDCAVFVDGSVSWSSCTLCLK